jgi:hypothetical protein
MDAADAEKERQDSLVAIASHGIDVTGSPDDGPPIMERSLNYLKSYVQAKYDSGEWRRDGYNPDQERAEDGKFGSGGGSSSGGKDKGESGHKSSPRGNELAKRLEGAKAQLTRANAKGQEKNAAAAKSSIDTLAAQLEQEDPHHPAAQAAREHAAGGKFEERPAHEKAAMAAAGKAIEARQAEQGVGNGEEASGEKTNFKGAKDHHEAAINHNVSGTRLSTRTKDPAIIEKAQAARVASEHAIKEQTLYASHKAAEANEAAAKAVEAKNPKAAKSFRLAAEAHRAAPPHPDEDPMHEEDDE